MGPREVSRIWDIPRMTWLRTLLVVLGVLHLACAHTEQNHTVEEVGSPSNTLEIFPKFALEGDTLEVLVYLNMEKFEEWRECRCIIEPVVVHEGPGRLSLQMKGERPCSLSHRGFSRTIPLGTFPTGQYTVRMGDAEGTFTVLPSSTDVGQLTRDTLISTAVALALHPNICHLRTGMRVCLTTDSVRLGRPKLYHQLRKAHPGASEPERMRAYIDALRIDIKEVEGGHFAYEFMSFLDDCDKKRERVWGLAHIKPTGEVDIGVPNRERLPDFSDE
jgi:hypothetical protein